jgi:hypothetical protein
MRPQAFDLKTFSTEGKETQFTALLHHVDADRLRDAFYVLKRDAAGRASFHSVHVPNCNIDGLGARFPE